MWCNGGYWPVYVNKCDKENRQVNWYKNYSYGIKYFFCFTRFWKLSLKTSCEYNMPACAMHIVLLICRCLAFNVAHTWSKNDMGRPVLLLHIHCQNVTFWKFVLEKCLRSTSYFFYIFFKKLSLFMVEIFSKNKPVRYVHSRWFFILAKPQLEPIYS